MTKASLSLPPGWIKARRYHLLAPLAALAVVLLLQNTWVAELLEDQTVNFRFVARSAFDPKPDPRLVFVTIDEFSLSQLGKWVWPRTVEADFLKSIVNAGVNPHTLTFDVLFTEESDKLHVKGNSVANDDQVFGDAMGQLPSVITGAQANLESDDPEVKKYDEKKTAEALANPGSTQPITNIVGDISGIFPYKVADFPVTPIRTQSLFGFVNDNPSNVDGIRHTLPLVVRVLDKVYPSLALQTLCQMLNIDSDKVEVDMTARVVRLKNSSGKTWTIPINESGEYYINYRREENFRKVSFAALTQNLINHANTGAPIAKECDIENKTLIIGGAAQGVVDMGPTPLKSRSPLP